MRLENFMSFSENTQNEIGERKKQKGPLSVSPPPPPITFPKVETSPQNPLAFSFNPFFTNTIPSTKQKLLSL